MTVRGQLSDDARALICRWVIGSIRLDELTALESSLRTLVHHGSDAFASKVLEGVGSPDSSERIGALLRAASLRSPTEVEAGIWLAKKIATEVLDGRKEPYQGAREIWWDVVSGSGRKELPDLLEAFVGLASEIEDDPVHRAEYEDEIVEECKALLAAHPHTFAWELTGE